MSTQQQSDRIVKVPHPTRDELVEGEPTGETRPRPDTPFRYAAIEIESGGVWSVPEEDIR